MADSFFSDARYELEFEANRWLRKIGSQISSIGTIQLLFWANTHYLSTLKNENDCDFQIFVLSFLNTYVRSRSYFPRKNGLMTDKTEQALLDSFYRYYSVVSRMRDIQSHLNHFDVHIPAVVNSQDIASFKGYYLKELAPFKEIMEGSIGCGPERIVEAFSSLASASLDSRQTLKPSSFMIKPQMNLPNFFLEIISSKLSENELTSSASFNWAIPSFINYPILRLDGAYFCFAPQMVFPNLLKLIRNAVFIIDDQAKAQWLAIESPVPEPQPAEDIPEEPKEAFPPVEEPQEVSPLDEEPEEEFPPVEEVKDDIVPPDGMHVKSHLDDGLDEEPEDYPDDEPSEDYYSEEDSEESEDSDDSEGLEDSESLEDDEIPESIQPSLFKEIIIENGQEALVDTPVVFEEKKIQENKIEVIERAVIEDVAEAEEPPEPLNTKEEPNELVKKVIKAAGPLSYLKNLEPEKEAQLGTLLDEAVEANRKDGKDKMFSNTEKAVSFCAVNPNQDAISRMEMENNIAAVMLVNEKTSWNAFIINAETLDVEYASIKKEQFPPRRWKSVQMIGWKLYLQMKKETK